MEMNMTCEDDSEKGVKPEYNINYINTNNDEDIMPLSKNAIKKLAKKKYYEENKLKLKQVMKEKDKEKKKLKKYKKEKQMNELNNIIKKGEIIEEQCIKTDKRKKEEITSDCCMNNIDISSGTNKENFISFHNPDFQVDNMKLNKREREKIFLEKSYQGIKIIIDCEFDEYMLEKEVVSLSSQLNYIYSLHKKTKEPFNLIFYNLGEKLAFYLMKARLFSWKGIKILTKDREKLQKMHPTLSDNLFYDIKDKSSLKNNDKDHFTWDDMTNEFKIKDIVYLTGDSNNTITDLKLDQAYVIGALVDRNRHKLLTLHKAEKLNIKHGKLPISDYLELKTSTILATNHIYDILINYNNCKDWKKTMEFCIPKRKINKTIENTDKIDNISNHSIDNSKIMSDIDKQDLI